MTEDGLFVQMRLTLEERQEVDRALLDGDKTDLMRGSKMPKTLNQQIWRWKPADFLQVVEAMDEREVVKADERTSTEVFTNLAARFRRVEREVLQFKHRYSE